MSQVECLDPQFECGLYEVWCRGIIDALIYKLNSQDEDTNHPNGLTLEEKFSHYKGQLDLPNLRKLKPDLYEILLSNVGHLLRKVCSEIPDPCDKLSFQSRFLENIFLNVLRENALLTEPTKYYYESVLDIFSQTTFGLPFFIDLMSDQGWYKYGSKLLALFSDEDQVKTILTKLEELSCDTHLTVLKVIWFIEASLTKYEDDDALLRFLEEANLLREQSSVKTFDLRENLNIYLSILNVYLEAFLVNTAKVAAREWGLDKPVDPNNCQSDKKLPKITIGFQPVSSISSLISDLEKNLFPDQQYSNADLLIDCFKDPKSAAILEMIASISGIYELLKVIAAEIEAWPLDQLKFDVFDAIKSAWDVGKDKADAIELSFWGLFSLKRFFAPDREECRFLTIAVLNTGVPKCIDILEVVSSETYLDPYVMHALGNAIARSERVEYMDDLILILKRVLRSLKSRKRITAFFKARVDLFGLFTYGKPHKSKLDLLINHYSSGSIMYDQVRDDILLSAYISPYNFLERIIADALEHRHTMLPFLCKLFCMELSPVCASVVDTRFDNTCLETLLNSRLSTPPSNVTVQGLMIVIKEIHTYYSHAKNPVLPRVFTLERLMLCFAWDGCCDPLYSVEAKLSIFKLIQSLSDAYDTPWDLVKKEPFNIVYNLLQFIDYFCYDGSRKDGILSIIEYVMTKKVCRKLTDSEFEWIRARSNFHDEEPCLLALLQPWLQSRLSKFIDVSKMKAVEVLLLAAFCKDNVWVRYANRPRIFNDYYLKGQLAFMLRIISRDDYDNLFYFLCHFLTIDETICALVRGYESQVEYGPINTEYITNCLLDCFEFHCENYYKEPHNYHCKKVIKPGLPKEKLLPLAFRHINHMYDFLSATSADAERIGKTLTKFAQQMKELNVDAFKWFFEKDVPLDMRSKHILRELYGPLYHIPKPYKEPSLRPG
ncbi:uncharacterized protein LOC107368893 [Tetranychus urticae]|nr:uncharacterized protein LOC107368893 [Tetranychus urticae]XP_015792266.1 uncharacterized protein LOC107368893 [Tetranychus urticae]XP_015792267.1 uncharacterized protein LOC107368893 [Tetranychus urticae]XP_015792268.1 uncharacterized protein LOC107368893 [Tetranychus urticae]